MSWRSLDTRSETAATGLVSGRAMNSRRDRSRHLPLGVLGAVARPYMLTETAAGDLPEQTVDQRILRLGRAGEPLVLQ
jgi:hypothetical protein